MAAKMTPAASAKLLRLPLPLARLRWLALVQFISTLYGLLASSYFNISLLPTVPATTPVQPTKLNPIQVSLLRLFERGMSDENTLELRQDYFTTGTLPR